jgi:hypothetical protein
MAFVPEGQDVLFRDIQKPLRHPSVGDSGWMQFPQGYRFMALLAADTLSASGTKHLTLFFSAMYFSSSAEPSCADAVSRPIIAATPIQMLAGRQNLPKNI